MSSAVELSNDTYLINYAVDDTVKDAATSQFVHVLAKAETPTGPFLAESGTFLAHPSTSTRLHPGLPQ